MGFFNRMVKREKKKPLRQQYKLCGAIGGAIGGSIGSSGGCIGIIVWGLLIFSNISTLSLNSVNLCKCLLVVKLQQNYSTQNLKKLLFFTLFIYINKLI